MLVLLKGDVDARELLAQLDHARLEPRVLAGVVALGPHLEAWEGPSRDTILVGEADARLAC